MNTRMIVTLAATLLLAAGCASTRTNPGVEEARAAVAAARNNPEVVRHARVELERAEARLVEADDALRKGEDTPIVEHIALLARNHAQIAEAIAGRRVAELGTDEAGAERERVRLEIRTAQLEAERARAEQAQLSAQAAQASAETAQRSAEEAQARAAALEAEAASLAEELEAKRTERGLVLTLGDVLFDTGRAELKPGAMPTIDTLGRFLQENPERTAQVEGYTDSVGTDEYNLTLSQRRADAVRTAILARGVNPERVSARGLGESQPVASNDDPGGRQMNRRVEIVIPD